jgi:hypothetical protein
MRLGEVSTEKTLNGLCWAEVQRRRVDKIGGAANSPKTVRRVPVTIIMASTFAAALALPIVAIRHLYQPLWRLGRGPRTTSKNAFS